MATDGLCECGCGARTPVAARTDRAKGYARGEPMRFLLGHNVARKVPPEEPGLCACGCGRTTRVHRGVARRFVHGHNAESRRLTEADWTVEDRGYKTPCWIWKGTPNKHGYGQVTLGGRRVHAHRAVYEQRAAPIEHRMVLHHLCAVKLCVRPDHVAVVAQGDHARLHGIPGWNRGA